MNKIIPLVDKTLPVQSPFLPGTNIQFAWDSTSLGYLKTCPRLYQYQMIDGWGARDESIHLRFGIEYHQALQDYDDAKAEGQDHAKATHHAVEQLLVRTHDWVVDTSERPGSLKNRNSLTMAVVWYLEHYRVDAAQTFILDNGKPATELSFRFELDWGPSAAERSYEPADGKSHPKDEPILWNSKSQPYLLCGHLDRVVTYQDEIFVMDRKTTTTTLSNYYFSQFEPNNQMTLYTLASKVILDSPIKGVIIDAVQILTASAEFQRGITYRTPKTLDEWVGDLQYYFAMAEQFAVANYWPMNDTACDKFGWCKFKKICSKDPSVRPQFLKTNFIKQELEERWNPLKPR